MSTHQPASPTPQPARIAKRRWPDMSFYGIHFGVVEMPNGEPRLVMVDEQGAWAPLAKRMGFAQSRWFGLYVKSSLKLDIPGFSSSFPSAKVIELTDEEIRARIKPLILARKDQRLSQMHTKGRLSWHPTKTQVSEAATQVVAAEGEDASETVSPAAALRQTLFLGMNYMGQDVFESGDGQRFIRSGDSVLAKEAGDFRGDPVFLRAQTDDDLIQVASGMVKEIDAGKRLHSDDFIRYIEAVHGAGSSEDKDLVGRFHAALDAAVRARVLAIEGAGRDAFEEALRLHEGRPSFWRAAGSLPTPLPIALVMQSLAQARAQSQDAVMADGPNVIDITDRPQSHSWTLKATSVSGGTLPAHDIALAGVFGRASAGQSVSGVRVTRTDTELLLSSLEKRTADGLTVFVMTATAAGKLDNEFRRAISVIGQKYEISGMTDIDPSMIGPGTEQASRLIVIGRKRANPDFTFAVSGEIPVVYDYNTLWSWGEALRASSFGEVQSFGDDGREENRWQAPYIPSSQVSEPKAMSPRNLLGPVRKALAAIVERNGMGIDEYVCSKLGWTMEQLEGEQRLDAEQVDAVAIGIQALDDGKGLVEADATGLGKGRVAAALCLYSKRKGLPVMFMTEKSDLFGDFYRDVADIGAMGELGNPFIVNNDLIVRHPDTAQEIARSPKREESASVFACGEFPQGYDMVLATYSQFNRVYNSSSVQANVSVARAIKGLLAGTVSTYDALVENRALLGVPDYVAAGVMDGNAAASYEAANASLLRAQGKEDESKAAEARSALFSAPTAEVVKFMSAAVRTDMTTLKHQWLYSGAMNGALLVLDEAHVAAGEVSQTGVNIRHIVENAGAVAYSSATYAKDIQNFVLYSRLFPSTLRAASISEVLSRGGEPMQEILSAMLAEDGRLVRREHDLSNLEFRVSVDTGRTERNEAWANALANVLAAMSYLSGEVSEIVSSINAEADKALERGKNGKPLPNSVRTGVHYTNFSSKFYNLFRAFSMAVNADQAADLAIKALKEGRKPVVTVENTMESVLRELVEGVELDEIESAAPSDQTKNQAGAAASLSAADPLAGVAGAVDPSAAQPAADENSTEASKTRVKKPDVIELGRRVSFKDILHAYVDVMFTASERVTKGSKVLHSKGLNLAKPELLEIAKQIHELIDSMPEVPLSPIDLVKQRIRDAGYSIDEISGRRMTLEDSPDGTSRVVRMSERKKQPIKNAFNSGKLDALVISKSGSTGISLHANRTFADQSQRELIELQPAADIAQRLQFWGRVNRKGQVCNPIIHMVSSGLPSEMRLIMMQNARLRRMSANISGNADNSAINDTAPDILNRIGNEVCYRWMEANPKVASILGYRVGDTPEDTLVFSNTKFVDMLTGKAGMLNVDMQRRVYSEITTEFNALIEQYELEGRNPLKSAEHDLRARKTGSVVVQVPSGLDSVFNGGVTATEVTYTISVDAINKEQVIAEADAGRAALVEARGATYAEDAVKSFETELEAALVTMLPKRFATVEAALADEKSNSVKNAIHKFDRLSELLPRITPGSILAFGNEAGIKKGDDEWLDYIYVTGWKLPESNKLSLANYRIVGYSRRSRKRIELTMSSLVSRPSVWVDADMAKDNRKSYDASAEHFFNRTSTPLTGDEKRIVLDGNLYRAAEIAEGQKQGSVITYSNEKGVWNHAVLMPKGFTLDNVMDLPVTVDNLDTLVAAVNSVEVDKRKRNGGRLYISDDFRNGIWRTHTYTIYAAPGDISIDVPGGATAKTGWLLNDEGVKRCLVGGAFVGNREQYNAGVIPGMDEEFLKAFMEAANKNQARVLLDGRKRAWYNEYLMERSGMKPKAAEMAAEALSTTADDELNALLAMTP